MECKPIVIHLRKDLLHQKWYTNDYSMSYESFTF